MKLWILVDIGCLECGEDSKVVGMFQTKERAERYWKEVYLIPGPERFEPDEFGYRHRNWGRPEWGGQHAPHIEEIEVGE